MKRRFLAAAIGLVCAGVVGEGFAAPGPAAPPVSPGGPGGGADQPKVVASPLTREQYLPKLREFYTRGAMIYAASRSDKLSDRDVDLRFSEFLAWANEAGNWMNGAIGPAALTRFTTWHAQFGVAHKLAGSHPEAADNKFSTLNIVLPQLLDNLKLMMSPDGSK